MYSRTLYIWGHAHLGTQGDYHILVLQTCEGCHIQFYMHVIPNMFYIYHHNVAINIIDGYKLIRMSCFEQTDAPGPHSPTGQSPPTPQARAKGAENKRARGPLPTHHPGPPKPRPKPVGPVPGGRNGPESKGSGLAHGFPTLHLGPPQATTQAGRPEPRAPHPPPTHHPSPELWSMVMSILGSIISCSGKNTILHVSIFRELV